MNNIINMLLLAENKIKSEMYLRQPGFTFRNTKNKKLKKTRDS